jgi:hypothetical protein
MTSQGPSFRVTDGWRRSAGGSVIFAAIACQAPAQLPAETAPRAETITASPPAMASTPGRSTDGKPTVVVSDERAVSTGATLPQQPLECVTGPDAEIDQESPWSKETGARLERLLPSLSACAAGISEPAELTMRLVYGPDGKSTSQHVVRSSPSACAATECLRKGLTQIVSPKLVIDRASYDIALVLERGRVRRAEEAPDALVDESDAAATSCVDPAIAALSREKIKEVIGTSFTDLKSCYSQALVRNHSAAGNVTFEFVIGAAGEVARAQVRDATLPDCSAIQCMLSEFRSLAFPPPVGRSVRIIYPINYVVEQPPVALR